MNVAECPKPTARETATAVRYGIADRIGIASTIGRLDLWIPLITDTPYQRVLACELPSGNHWSVTREPGHGNQMAHLRLDEMNGPLNVEIRYDIERLPITHELHESCVRPLGDPTPFSQHLAPERHVDVNDATRTLANSVVAGETSPLRQARCLFDYVTGAMQYDATQQSGTGSTQHAMTCSVGNCNDIHALFISLARSVGIPARLVLGQALEPTVPGEEDCDICGYHCWAEFFATGLGWIPVDASCTCKFGTEGLFGSLEMNHVAWSVGRDLQLAPPQSGSPVLFFAGPYAELDGEPGPTIERHLVVSEG